MEYKDIKNIIKDMEESSLDSLDLELSDGTKISMSKGNKKNQEVIVNTSYENVSNDTNVVIAPKEEIGTVIKSPIVGTFYSSPSPDKDPFVKIGDKVKKGDVICIIEAMKLINEIESETDGEIVEIFVKNEEIVDYGKPLFRIK